MNKIFIYFLLFTFLSCENKKNEKTEKNEKREWGYNSFFPEGFIDPKTDVNDKINPETDDIIQSLTTYTFRNEQGWSCSDKNGNSCDGNISIPMKIFINYNINKKDISFLKTYEGNCDCYKVFHIMKELYTIQIKDISRVDTIGDYNRTKDGKKLTAINIISKYDQNSIEYKGINREYDSLESEILYKKVDYKTGSIQFETDWKLARQIKQKIEKLKELN